MSAPIKPPRLLVIGLDGATFDLLQPMAAQGWLPNLSRAMDQGARGVLQSTVPPLTAPAWCSFMTGLGPGGHGIFSFRHPLDNHLERTFVNSSDLRVPRLWHWLAEHGLTTGVVNLPMTWPPQPMPAGSYVVTGMLTPSIESPFTDPPELADGLRQAGYVCDLRIKLHERDFQSATGMTGIAQDLHQVLLRREEAIFRLLQDNPTDVFTVVFETWDRLQHWAWQAIEELLADDGSLERTALHEAVESCYRELDRVVGRLLAEAAAPETHVFFLSDHGFGPLRYRFHVDQWLAEQGWLVYTTGKATMRQRLRAPLRRVKRLIPRTLLQRGRQALAVSRLIDWDRTSAYSGYAMEHAIYLNLRGREPYGSLDPADGGQVLGQIEEALLAVRDPHSGLPVVQKTYRREEVYRGRYSANAPDLLFTLAPGYEPTSELSSTGVISAAAAEGAGIHQQAGVFMALGPGVRRGAVLPEHSIEDVLPTMFYALDLALPSTLDGQIIEALFEPGFLASHPPLRGGDALPEVALLDGHGVSSADESAAIADRLTALGYLR